MVSNRSSNVVKHTSGQDLQAGDTQREGNVAVQALVPAADIYEDDDAVHVVADMPGVTPDSLSVELENNLLEISGDIRLAMPEGVSATFAEIRASRYQRRFNIGQAIDREGIKAHISDGVLQLTLPKAQSHRRRRIEIKAA